VTYRVWCEVIEYLLCHANINTASACLYITCTCCTNKTFRLQCL